MKREIKEVFEQYGFVMKKDKAFYLDSCPWEIDAFPIYYYEYYDEGVTTDAEVVEANLEMAELMLKHMKEVVYALKHIKDKVEEM
jgi:hypothetical protein